MVDVDNKWFRGAYNIFKKNCVKFICGLYATWNEKRGIIIECVDSK